MYISLARLRDCETIFRPVPPGGLGLSNRLNYPHLRRAVNVRIIGLKTRDSCGTPFDKQLSVKRDPSGHTKSARRNEAKSRHWLSDAGQCVAAEFQLRRDLPDDAGVVGPADVRRAVEIPLRVECHVAKRLPAVAPVGEVVKSSVGPTAA